MKLLASQEFLITAGIQVPHPRDMSVYDGKPFECACGSMHEFHSFMSHRNFASSGANATIMVSCPLNREIATLIKTKYKFLVVFDRFESLAGYVPS